MLLQFSLLFRIYLLPTLVCFSVNHLFTSGVFCEAAILKRD